MITTNYSTLQSRCGQYYVNTRRYNRQQLNRKIRIATHDAHIAMGPRLIKGFHNRPSFIVK